MLRSVRRAVQDWLWWWRSVPLCGPAYLRDLHGRPRYRLLTEEELRTTRTSDTVFVYGSGTSISDIAHAEWAAMAQHNTVSFREFPRQRFIRADLHLTAEVDDLQEYAARLRENPLYAQTVLVVQEGWAAHNGNDLVGRGLLPPGARVFRFRRRSRGRYEPPSRSFADGLVHGFNSAIDAVNLAYLVGWKTIVLVGVDLNDKGYFWLPKGQTREYEKPGLSYESRFTNADQIVPMLGQWAALLEAEGVRLFVYSPRSLLASALPVFGKERLLAEGAP